MVGIFATAAIVMVYFGVQFLKGSDFFSTTSKYYAEYGNVNSLSLSNPVQVNGFTVGRVSDIKIQPDKNHTVLVELEIDSDIKLGQETKAVLNSEMLGGKYIQLSIGPLTDKNILKPGSIIQAVVAKGMLDVVNEKAEPVANDVQTVLAKFNTAVEGMTKITQRLDSILADLQKTPDLLNATLRNTNGKINALSGNFNDVATNLNTTLIELRPTLKNFNVLSDSLKKMELNKTILKTQQTMTSINQTLLLLRKGDNTASKLLTEDALYVNLNRLLKSMDSLVSHINNNPKHFMGPLGQSRKKVLRDLKRQEEEQNKAAAAAAKK